MMFDSYQRVARKTVVYPNKQKIIYPALGLAGEAGEVCEKIKKYLRQDYELEELKEIIESELGDVLWYLENLATDLEISLDKIAAGNLSKLSDRQNRGKLKGDGDNR